MIRHNIPLYIIGAVMPFTVTSCRKQSPQAKVVQENAAAKRMLQGVWIDQEDESIVFKAQGDTIYYPDSTSAPAYFMIDGDTLVLQGANRVTYPIVRQTAHAFRFRNATGDVVSLVKSTDKADNDWFSNSQPLPLNQNRLIKRDTVIVYGNDRYHSYVQVNPTTYKVVKASFNDDGVEVDNIYHDNIIHISVFRGGYKLFSRDFHKQDFARQVPADFLQQSILSDMVLAAMDSRGTHFQAQLVIPDSQSSFLVDVTVDFRGGMRMAVKK